MVCPPLRALLLASTGHGFAVWCVPPPTHTSCLCCTPTSICTPTPPSALLLYIHVGRTPSTMRCRLHTGVHLGFVWCPPPPAACPYAARKRPRGMGFVCTPYLRYTPASTGGGFGAPPLLALHSSIIHWAWGFYSCITRCHTTGIGLLLAPMRLT